MIKKINENIDLNSLEERLANELEDKIELGTWCFICGCDDFCGVDGDPCTGVYGDVCGVETCVGNTPC